MESVNSKAGSGSEDEPLVPDDFDDDFLKNLLGKVPEITKALRQKDTHENADNVQRLVICANRYKSDWRREEKHVENLEEKIKELEESLECANNQSRLDRDTIAELRKVIEDAWRQKDAAQIREQTAQDEMLKLREKVDMLEQTVQHLSDKRLTLQSKRDDIKERERLKQEIKDLNKRIQIQRLYITEVETTTQSLEAKNKSLVRLLDETSSEAYNGKRRIELLQTELTQLKAEEVKYLEQISHMKATTEKLTKMKVRQNLQILSLKTNLEHLNTQHNATCNKLAKITVELEYAVQDRDKNKRDLMQRINLLKVREDEIMKLKQENSKLVKSQENTARKYGALNEDKQTAVVEANRLKIGMKTQDKELESMRRIIHHFETINENITKERDLLKRDLLLEQKTAAESNEQFQESQHEIKTLQEIISQMEMKQKKQQDDYAKLKNEKTKKVDEIQMLLDKIDALQNDIHLKENYEIELKRTITDLELKSGKFQAQHDALNSEKNNLQRALQSAEDDKSKLKQQISNIQQNIETLKSKISYRDAELGKLQLQLDKMEKERRLLRTEVRSAKLGQQHTRAELMEKKKYNDRCTKSLREDEQKLSHLKKERDKLMDEKNAICGGLTKRNEEYAQLKDNLENLQTVYDQTEKRFSQCQDDMRLMRIEIKNLRTERNVLRKDREAAADLRQELLQIHRLLNQERIKARALQEEMMTPMNIHRWRNLRGKDPEKMDLIERIQLLRKQILSQNVAALEQERALEETQHLYSALKEFMLKLPSHKVRAELNEVRATLSSKERKLKALMAELNVKQADEKSNTIKLEELKTSLASAKSQLSEEKKKKEKLLEERQLLVQMQAQCFSAPPTMQRTLGAGFKLVGGF